MLAIVRDKLTPLQRRLAATGGVVLEGRDTGTVVCPDAEVKFYLDASLEERARRRQAELRARGVELDSGGGPARDRRARRPGLEPRAGAAAQGAPTPSRSTPPASAWTRSWPRMAEAVERRRRDRGVRVADAVRDR